MGVPSIMHHSYTTYDAFVQLHVAGQLTLNEATLFHCSNQQLNELLSLEI